MVYTTEQRSFAQPDELDAVRVAGGKPVVMGDWFLDNTAPSRCRRLL